MIVLADDELNPTEAHGTISSVGGERLRPEGGRLDCIFVFGYGKSGSKRILRLFDYSPETHCRNEPYHHPDSPWKRLRTQPRSWLTGADDERVLQAEWDDAVRWCADRMGDRDFVPQGQKTFHHPVARRLGLIRLLASNRGRRIAGILLPSLRNGEWRLPHWAGSRSALAQAIPVLRINQAPGLAAWALRHRPFQKIVHIVRHPGAVLHSWRVRFLAHCDPEAVRGESVNRLALIARADRDWGARFGNLDAMPVEGAEMWFWVYATEVTDGAGRGLAHYVRVLDEDVALSPAATTARLFADCGLGWTRDVEEAIGAHAAEWKRHTVVWRQLLDRPTVKLIDRILASSNVGDWWDPDQVVSRPSYRLP